MTVKWKAAIVGGTVIGIGLGGFAAADDIERPSPDSQVLQQSAGSSSGRWMKRKGVSWFPVAPVGGFSADSTFSNGSSAPAPAPAPSRGSFSADSSFSNDSPAPAPAPSPGSFNNSNSGGGGGGGGSGSFSGGGSS